MITNNYLFERLCGALVYCSILVFFYERIKRIETKERLQHTLLLYTVVLSIMAFFYIPSKEADLTRLLQMGRIWVEGGFDNFIKIILPSSSAPAAYILIYVCTLTGIDGLLPAISALVYYCNIFRIIQIVSEEKAEYASKTAAMLVLFTMASGTFLSVISGIRTTMAFSIIAKCYFEEMYLDKSFVSHIPLYLIAILLHSVSVPVVAIRIFALFFSNSKSWLMKFLQIIVMISFVSFSFKYGNDYILVAFDKYEAYTTTATYINNKMYYSSIFSFFIYEILIFSFLVKRRNNYKRSAYGLFLMSMSAFEILMIRNFVIFARFLSFLSILVVPVIAEYLCATVPSDGSESHISYYRPIANRNMIIILAIFLLLSYLTGDLSAYKFFVL